MTGAVGAITDALPLVAAGPAFVGICDGRGRLCCGECCTGGFCGAFSAVGIRDGRDVGDVQVAPAAPPLAALVFISPNCRCADEAEELRL